VDREAQRGTENIEQGTRNNELGVGRGSEGKVVLNQGANEIS